MVEVSVKRNLNIVSMEEDRELGVWKEGHL